MRSRLIIICLVVSAISAYFGQPLIEDNPDALLVLVTVMTVFAGFLVAIITILGDPSLIPDTSWQSAEKHRSTVEARLSTNLWLFVFYLITILFLFLGILLKKAPDSEIGPIIKIWVGRIYMFFGVSSFLFTFALPRALWKFQMARIDAEIKRRRQDVGFKD